MATALTFGPADHGRPVTDDEMEAASWEDGYRYEVIDGRLYVSPAANPPHNVVEMWLLRRLDRYSERRPDITNYVALNTAVPLTGRERTTIPQPDLTAYRDFPTDLDPAEIRWVDLLPILVVEIVSPSDPGKDFERNVELYLEVPSIREYWVVDPRASARTPSMTVYRRRGARWQKPIAVPPGGTYETRLLPDFSLTLDIRR